MLGLIALLSASSAKAEINQFQLFGTLNSVSTDALGTFQVGGSFVISVTYDSSTAGIQTPALGLASYENAITAYEFNYENGTYVGTATGRMFIYNNFDGWTNDEVQFDMASTMNFAPIGGSAVSNMGPFFFLSGPGDLLNTVDLPAAFPTDWTSGYFNISWGEGYMGMPGEQTTISGTITGVQAIPELATYPLVLALASLAWSCIRRRR
jgi:hypothetical protein